MGDAYHTPVKLRPGAKPKACRRCHQRKVKCSGGRPCDGCRQASKESDCIYPRGERVVRVSQRYIEDLRAENLRLRSQGLSPAPRADGADTEVADSRQAAVSGRDDGDAQCAGGPSQDTGRGPTLSATPWFVDIHVPHTPILVAEASDSAFATRFRQAMSTEQHSHLPRVDYPSDESILTLSDSPCPWPDPGKARLLVDIAVKSLGRCYHIVRGSVVREELEQMLQNPAGVGTIISKSKLWALFAIGEMYVTRTTAREKPFPGIAYFAKATKSLRLVSERPTIEMVEVWLLLSFYSLCLNRRHSAYSLAGSAIRVAIIMGLHLNVPKSRLGDELAREHRVRVWWTAYTFDRMWAAKLGYPFAIRDSDIEVDVPSDPPLASRTTDFPDHTYFVARLGLARLSGRIISSIYTRGDKRHSLSQTVQDALKNLRQWLDELPASLQIDPQREAETDPRARSLQLNFNQLAILTTRPILLHVLRKHLDACNAATMGGSSHHDQVPASAMALSEACVRFARHSHRLLADSWVNGSFMMFDYFYTQYLFSSGTVLAASSILGGNDSRADREQFSTTADFLCQLKENGNFAAAEFHGHIEVMSQLVTSTEQHIQAQRQDQQQDQLPIMAMPDLAAAHENSSRGNGNVLGAASASGMMTGEMAVSEVVFQNLLEQPLSDLEFIDTSMYLDGSQDFCWADPYPEN